MRDRRADEAYFARFDANAQYAIDTRAGVVHDLSKAIADPSRFASDTQRFVMGNMNKALAAYALGADLGVVREYAARAGDAWVLERETGKTYLAPDVSEVRYNFRTRRDTYVDSLQ
ncbi:hypothetical protein ITJ38_10495, partial [Agreia pratensis]|uniref:hypothetical protein n=1 Tax=Agreia pratensis TaxID=150121 RepID=UPI00188D6AF8